MENEDLKGRIVDAFCNLTGLLSQLAAESAAGIQQLFRDDDLEGAQAAFQGASQSSTASKQIEHVMAEWRKAIYPVQGQPQAFLDKTVKQLVQQASAPRPAATEPAWIRENKKQPREGDFCASTKDVERFVLTTLYNSVGGATTSAGMAAKYDIEYRDRFTDHEKALTERGDVTIGSRRFTQILYAMKNNGLISKPSQRTLAITNKGKERVERDVIGE